MLFEGKQLKEWDGDFIGSDFDLSDGRITSMVVTDGPMDEIEKTHYRLDSVFSSQYGMGENLKQKEWVGEGNNYYIEYLNFYDYNTYRICLALRLYSPTKDESNVSRGVVRVGLGERKE